MKVIATQGSRRLVSEDGEFWVEGTPMREDSPYVFLRHGVWNIVGSLQKHYGPGPHLTGTPQSIHGAGSRGTSARRILQVTHDEGGISIDPLTGEQPSSGYMVALPKYNRHFIGQPTVRQMRRYVAEHWQVAVQENHYIGTWENKGETDLDVSIIVNDRDEAIRLGRENGEDAIFDLQTFKDIVLKSRRSASKLED